MGNWGFGIEQDDAVADVVAFVTARLKAGDSLDSASTQARSQFAELERDAEDAPLLWMALAHIQWRYGTVDQDILRRVRDDIAAERGLARWREDPKLLGKRKDALSKFLATVAVPNPKPSAAPKLVVRKAPYRPGDCLSVRLPDGRYTAALVLREDNSNPEAGMNLVASLNYCETQSPSLAVFERREWLVLSQGSWAGQRDIRWYLPIQFNQVRKRITVVENIGASSLVPEGSSTYAGWHHLGKQIVVVRDDSSGHVV